MTRAEEASLQVHAQQRVPSPPVNDYVVIALTTYFSVFSAHPAIWLALCGAILLRLFARPRPLQGIYLSLGVLAYLSWVILSLFWSIAPDLTFNNAVRLTLTTFLAASLAANRDLKEILRLAATSASIVLLACWSYALISRSQAFSQEAADFGAFKGLMVNKNAMGFYAVYSFLVLACAALATSQTRARSVFGGSAFLAVLTVFATTSGTARAILLIMVAAGITLAFITRLRRPRHIAVTIMLTAALGIVGFLMLNPDLVTSSLDKDPSLTGRTKIWDVTMAAVLERPLTGYGWGALWHEGTPLTEQLWAENGYPIPHAHNGYLDITAQLGLVGVFITFGLFLWLLVTSFKYFLTAQAIEVLWACLFAAMIFAYNSSEVIGFRDTTWIITVAMIGCISSRGGASLVPRLRNQAVGA